jgi:hypothetical protein
MIGKLLQSVRRLTMKIYKVLSARNRGAIVSHEDDKLKYERMERLLLQQRIRTMDVEIDNIGRRRK